MIVTYDSIDFEVTQTVLWEQRAVYSDDGVDKIVNHVRMGFRFVMNPAATFIAGTGQARGPVIGMPAMTAAPTAKHSTSNSAPSSASHKRRVLSMEALARRRPSGAKHTLVTGWVCP